MANLPHTVSRRRQRGLSTLILVVLIAILLLLAGGGALAALYFTGVIHGKKPQAVTVRKADGATGTDATAGEPAAPPQYLPLDPPLVVNFDNKGRVGYLQVSINVMAHSKAAISAVRDNMPVVRNNLILLMSSKSYEQLDSREEKEKLREQARDEINRVLKAQGSGEQISEVYFTAFVMQ